MPLLLVWARWNESWGRLGAPVTLIMKDCVDGVQHVPLQIKEEDVPVPQIMEKLGDSVQPLPSKPIQERNLEQISLVLRIMEKIGVAVQYVPSERIQEQIVEQISAADHGENRGCFSACACGAHARTNRGADFCGAPDQRKLGK